MKSLTLIQAMTKAEKVIYSKIKANTDRMGWGLENSEIIEMTGFDATVVAKTINKLIRSGHLKTHVSNVANHIFFSDAKWGKK